MTDRGIRNQNPFNIDYDPNVKWQGLVGIETGVPSPRFCVFKTAQFGIRAGAKVLLTYQTHDGCKTIRQIITRFAPGVENNTAAYIAAICAALKAAGLSDDPDAEIDVDTSAVMTVLVNAIIAHENSGYVYPPTVVSEGIRLAGVSDAPPKPLMTQGTFVTKAAAAVSVAGGSCVEACKALIADPSKVHGISDQVKDAAGQLDAFSGVAIFDHVKTALLTVGGGLLVTSMVLSAMKQKAS